MLIVFFVVPFGTMIAVSFFQRQQGGFYTPDFVFDNYARFLSMFFAGVLGFSLMLAIVVAICCVVLALPFTYLLTRMTRQAQIVWLVALLSVLSLSEVIIGFAWSTLFSRTAGITNLFVTLGIMEQAKALTPSFGAVLTGMVYQAFPYTVLVLYPALVRLDPDADRGRAHARRVAAQGLLHRRRAGPAQHHHRDADHGLHLRARLLSAAATARPTAALDAVGADHRSGDLPVQHAVRGGDGGVPRAGDAGAGGADRHCRTQGRSRMSNDAAQSISSP